MQVKAAEQGAHQARIRRVHIEKQLYSAHKQSKEAIDADFVTSANIMINNLSLAFSKVDAKRIYSLLRPCYRPFMPNSTSIAGEDGVVVHGFTRAQIS